MGVKRLQLVLSIKNAGPGSDRFSSRHSCEHSGLLGLKSLVQIAQLRFHFLPYRCYRGPSGFSGRPELGSYTSAMFVIMVPSRLIDLLLASRCMGHIFPHPVPLCDMTVLHRHKRPWPAWCSSSPHHVSCSFSRDKGGRFSLK